MNEELIQEVIATTIAVEAKREEPRRLRAEAAAMGREIEADETRHSLLREDLDAAAARRLIDGPDAAPENPRDRKQLNRLAEGRPVKIAAKALLVERAAAAELEIEPLKIPQASASLRLVVAVQGDGISEMREALSALAPAAARLLAGDHILAATVGTSGFPVPPGTPIPVKGSILVERLIKAIPETLLPDSLKAEELAAAARAISAPIVSRLKGTK